MPVVQERKSYLAKSSIVSRFLNDLIKSRELPYGAVTYLKNAEPHMVVVGMAGTEMMTVAMDWLRVKGYAVGENPLDSHSFYVVDSHFG